MLCQKMGWASEQRCPRKLASVCIEPVYASLTNDLLYESNDSRDILNGSCSLTSLPRFEYEVEVVDVRLKKPFFSGGGG
jgi:hypothetical protein